jgi:hypothetical protein
MWWWCFERRRRREKSRGAYKRNGGCKVNMEMSI